MEHFSEGVVSPIILITCLIPLGSQGTMWNVLGEHAGGLQQWDFTVQRWRRAPGKRFSGPYSGLGPQIFKDRIEALWARKGL